MNSFFIISIILSSFALQCSSYTVETVKQSLQFGHSPLWDVERQSWYFTDLFAPVGSPQIYRMNEVTRVVFGAQIRGYTGGVAFLIPLAGTFNKFVAGVQRRVICVIWDGLSTQATECGEVFQVEQSLATNLMHDGKVDPKGRLYVKTFNTQLCGPPPQSSIYKFTRVSGVVDEIPGLKIPSGITWNKAIQKFYYIDYCSFNVNECSWNSLTGALTDCRVVYSENIGSQSPLFGFTGLTSDKAGGVYMGVFNKSEIYKIQPSTGKLIETFTLPVPTIIGIALGGPRLNTILVTTSAFIFDKTTGVKLPITVPSDAGSVFLVKNVDGVGWPAHRMRF